MVSGLVSFVDRFDAFFALQSRGLVIHFVLRGLVFGFAHLRSYSAFSERVVSTVSVVWS